jgi:polysaccharide export outer membrane protein
MKFPARKRTCRGVFLMLACAMGLGLGARAQSTPVARDAAQTVDRAAPAGTVEPARAITVPAPSAGSAPAVPAAAPARSRLAALRFGPGDLMQITVFGAPELAQESRVSDAGEVSLALLGNVNVAGLTIDETRRLLESKLKEGGFLRDPHVTVVGKEFVTQGISVLGEVQKPGTYPALSTPRLFDAISAAGGLSPRAGKMVTITHRESPDQPVDVEVSNDLRSRNNPELYPGDTVVVARAGVVYVVGDVTHPAGFVMDNNDHMTVLQAVALAGGTLNTAKLADGRIIRRSPTGVQEIPVNLKQLLSAKASDPDLKAEDILFVPSSAAKRAARRGVESIIQITTGLALMAH